MDDKGSSAQDAKRHMNLILVVDDEPVNLLVLSGVLEHHYQVRTARGGTEALVAAAAEPQPDLILLDIMMPDMDGFEVLRRLRANEGQHNRFRSSSQQPCPMKAANSGVSKWVRRTTFTSQSGPPS